MDCPLGLTSVRSSHGPDSDVHSWDSPFLTGALSADASLPLHYAGPASPDGLHPDCSCQGSQGDLYDWTLDCSAGGAAPSVAAPGDLVLPEDSGLGLSYPKGIVPMETGLYSTMAGHSAYALLPASSGLSDVTDSSGCTDASQYASVPFSESSFAPSSAPFPCPAGLPGSVADDSVSHPGHIWNFNPVAGDAHPVAYGVPYSHSGRKESRPPRGHHAPSSANLGAFGQQGIPIAGAGMHLPLSPQSLMQRQLSAGSAMSEPADGVTGYAISTGPRSISGTGSLPGPVGLPSAPPGVHVPLDAVPRYVSGLPGLVPVRAPSFSRASGLPMERGWSNPSLSDGSPTAQLPFDLDEAVFCLSPTAPPGGRRLSEESDLSIARSHPFYQAPPREDGLYHCPFEGDGCKHKAETLKCNYHKHIDSHLRPYRCKMANCSKLQFSSTACLLRHEREAHGLHGHGDKPFTCPFDDCDRSEPGNGFPRKWNLADHMKRVHNYTGTGQTAAAGHKATSVAAASDGILDGLPANSKKGAVVKKTKPRRNSKTAPAVGPRNMSRMAYAPPTGSLPDHVQLFGPDHSSVHGYVDRGAHLMQTSRSLDPLALEPVPSFPDPYGTFDPEAFRLPSGLPMDLAPTGYEMSGAGAGAGASPQWAMLMDHSQ